MGDRRPALFIRRSTSMVPPPSLLALILSENSSTSHTPEMTVRDIRMGMRGGFASPGAGAQQFSHLPKRRRRYCSC